jgi:hypothetical protein
MASPIPRAVTIANERNMTSSLCFDAHELGCRKTSVLFRPDNLSDADRLRADERVGLAFSFTARRTERLGIRAAILSHQ